MLQYVPALLAAAVAFMVACDAEPAGPRSSLYIDNRSSAWSVTGAYLSPTGGDPGWGLNELTSDIEPGEYYTVECEPDTYDIRVESDHPESPLQEFGIVIAEGMGVVVTVTDESMEAVW